MTTKLPATLITVFWLAMMTSLVVNDILPERRRARTSLVDPEILALQWMDLHDWSWVQHNGEIVGGMATQVLRPRHPGEKDNDNLGYVAHQTAEADINLLGLRRNVRFKLTLRLNSTFHVADFVALIASKNIAIECAGFIRDEELFYRITPRNARPVYRSIPLPGPISLSEAVRPVIARHFDLEVGQTFATDVVDPIFGMRGGKVTLRVAERTTIEHEGEEIEVFRIEQSFENITKSSWVTDNGITIRRELFQGYTLEKSNKPSVRLKYPDVANILRMPEFNHAEFIRMAREGNAQKPGPGAIPQFNILSLFMGNAPASGPANR